MKLIDATGLFALSLILVVCLFVLIVFMPFAQIWALNTLFRTEIDYSWRSWLAVIIINSSLQMLSYNRNKS